LECIETAKQAIKCSRWIPLGERSAPQIERTVYNVYMVPELSHRCQIIFIQQLNNFTQVTSELLSYVYANLIIFIEYIHVEENKSGCSFIKTLCNDSQVYLSRNLFT